VLAPEAVNRLLAAEGQPLEALVSTDDNLRVAYRAPRADLLAQDKSLQENLEALRKFQPESVYEGTRLSPAVSQETAP
jgi:hypothetical protein